MPRGGARKGAGRKPKPLAEKIAAGNPSKRPLKKLEFADNSEVTLEPPEYLHMMQKKHRNFGVLTPVQIFENTVKFLARTGCLHLIHEDLIANYATARHYLLCAQSELSDTTFVSRNKANEMYITTYGEAMLVLQKNVILTWNPIWDIVSRNSEKVITNPEKELTAILVGGRTRRVKPKGEPPNAEYAYHEENADSETDSGKV